MKQHQRQQQQTKPTLVIVVEQLVAAKASGDVIQVEAAIANWRELARQLSIPAVVVINNQDELDLELIRQYIWAVQNGHIPAITSGFITSSGMVTTIEEWFAVGQPGAIDKRAAVGKQPERKPERKNSSSSSSR